MGFRVSSLVHGWDCINNVNFYSFLGLSIHIEMQNVTHKRQSRV